MAHGGDGGAGILVLGIGNVLLKDEGVGVRAVEELRRSHVLPPGVEVVDGGTAGLDLLDVMEQAEHVIVIDCVLAEEAPGAILRYPLDEFDAPAGIPQSLHEVGLLEALGVLTLLGRRPRAVLIGVQPAEIAPGLDLSPRVAARLPAVVEAVVQELEHLGVRPLAKSPAP